MSKRLASLFLIYGVLAALIAPAGLVAQEEQPDLAVQQQETTTTETQPQPAPQPAKPAPAPPPPKAAAPPPAAPAPAKEEEPAPIAVASGPGSVTIRDFSFGPSSVTVNVGDTVTWTNAGPTAHTATGSGFDTGLLRRGASGSHTFDEAGTFSYKCTPHPNMTGTVRVVAAANEGGSGQSGDTPDAGGSAPSTSGSTPSTGTGTGSAADLPATGVDAGGLAVIGLGFLALGLFARRRTA
jgi:LPXTG-motif cell wall-anchored protein